MSPRLLALIPLGVGINIALGKLVSATQLPLFLDTTGTALIACLVGLVPALIAAVVSQCVMAVIDTPIWLAFLPVHLAIAAYAALAARRGWFSSAGRAVVAGLGLGVVGALCSWPISYFMFGGVTTGGAAVVTTLLTGFGIPRGIAVLISALVNDLLDKSVIFLLIHTTLIGLPRRMAARYPDAMRAIGRA